MRSPTAARPRRRMRTRGPRAKRSPTAASAARSRSRRRSTSMRLSDHAEFMGVFNQMANPDSPLSKTELAKQVTSPDANVRIQTFAKLLRDMSDGQARSDAERPGAGALRVVRNRESGGRELSARQVHDVRRVRVDLESEQTQPASCRRVSRHCKLPEMVLSSLDSDDPEDVVEVDDRPARQRIDAAGDPAQRQRQRRPHVRTGQIRRKTDRRRVQQDARRQEPLYEITQIKGTSETTPQLSPNDEFANFELWNYTLSADAERPTHRKGSFARQALLDGLSQDAVETAIRSNTASSATATRTMPRRATKSSTTPASSRSRTMRKTG